MDNQYVCINDLFTGRQMKLFINLPKLNHTYTLKEQVTSPIDGKVGFVFYELENPKHDNGQEFSFRPSRFIPLNKIKDKSKLVEEELVETV